MFICDAFCGTAQKGDVSAVAFAVMLVQYAQFEGSLLVSVSISVGQEDLSIPGSQSLYGFVSKARSAPRHEINFVCQVREAV